MRCLVVVPTYNEALSITRLLDDLLAATGTEGPDVLVVDDSSPDGTGELVRAHPLFGSRVHLLTRTTKDGLGAAYRAGFARALQGGYDAIVQLDADGSHPVDQVPAMVALLASQDLVVGSRYAVGGRTRNWPVKRRALSRAANLYARSLLLLRTKDCTAGFRAWRASALVRTGVLQTTSSGYGFQVENTWRAERAGLRIAEHPITFTDRTDGVSKMTGQVALEAARLVLAWRLAELGRSLGLRRSTPTLRRPLDLRR